MTNLYERIRNIEARLNRMKTQSAFSSSSLAVAEQNITLPFQIVGTDIASGVVYSASSSRQAFVCIDTAEPAFVALRILSPTAFGDSVVFIRKTLHNIGSARYGYWCEILGGDSAIAALNNGQTLPLIDYEFKILCTSDFTVSINWVNTPIIIR